MINFTGIRYLRYPFIQTNQYLTYNMAKLISISIYNGTTLKKLDNRKNKLYLSQIKYPTDTNKPYKNGYYSPINK